MTDVHHIVRKRVDVLYQSSRMRDEFQDPPIVDLCGVLVHGKTSGAMKSANLNCKPGRDNCDRFLDVADTSS